MSNYVDAETDVGVAWLVIEIGRHWGRRSKGHHLQMLGCKCLQRVPLHN